MSFGTTPIDIKRPIVNRPSTPGSSPTTRRLVMKGGPFHNISTVRDIIHDCVPQLSPEQVYNMVDKAHASGFVELLVSDDQTMRKSCACLVENGMYADLDSSDSSDS